MNPKGLYERKFKVYSKSASIKYKAFIANIYNHLNVKELTKLRTTIVEAKVTDLEFF